MRILITALALLLANVGMSQTKFFKLYSSEGDEDGQGVVELEDSTYALTGSSSSFPGGIGSQAFLVKTDTIGNFLWSKHYGGEESEVGRRIMYVKDEGYFIAGYTDSYGQGGFDYYLVKTDLNGDMIWENTYGGTAWDRVYDASLTQDTGVVMVGFTTSNPTENQDIYIVRTDNDGNELWSQTFGGAGDDRLESLVNYHDSTYFAVGTVFVEDSARSYAFSMFFNVDGTIYWKDTLGMSETDEFFFTDLCVDTVLNNLSMVGYRIRYGTGQKDVLYTLMTLAGNVDGYYSNSTEGDHMGVGITTYGIPGNRYIGFYYDDQWSFDDGVDASFQVFDAFLAPSLGGFAVNFPKPDLIHQMMPTLDGGAIMIGRTNAEGIGVNHAWLAKVGPFDDFPDSSSPHDLETVVSVAEAELEDFLEVYPNPSNGIVNIESAINDAVEIEIISNLGQRMRLVKMNGAMKIDFSTYPSGVYHLKTVTSSGISNVRKIVIQH
jgi:hypothetical protein